MLTYGVTLLMSVHQPALAQRYAERIIGLRQGRVVFDGASADLSQSVLHTIYGREVNLGGATTVDQQDGESIRPDQQFYSTPIEQEFSL